MSAFSLQLPKWAAGVIGGVVVAALAALLLFGCASMRLPATPEGATLLNVSPIRCGNVILTFRIYDTDPESRAGIGVVTGPHGEEVMVIIQDRNGAVRVYGHSADGGVRSWTEAEWLASGLDACALFETRATRR